MALVGYSFDPDAKRSDVVKEINQDLDRMGVGISRDTIHKWLRDE